MAKKANGNGVREVSPGKFVATMYDPRAKGGTKHVGTFKVGNGPADYPTRREAKKAADDAKRAAEKLRDLQLKSPETEETVRSFATRYPEDYQGKRTISTVEHQRDRLVAFIRDFGDRPLGSITPMEALAWSKGGIVPPQIRKTALKWHGAKQVGDGDVEVPHHRSNFQVVVTMYNDAVRTFKPVDPTFSNPFADLKVERTLGRKGERITILSESELALLVDTCIDVFGEGYGRHFGALIEAQAWTGLRPGETWATSISPVLGTEKRVNYVDFDRGEIDVRWQVDKRNRRRPPKHKREGGGRTVYLLPPARSAYERGMIDPISGERRKEGSVWLTKRDLSPMTGRTLGYYWDKVRSVFWANLPDDRRSLIAERDGGPERGKIAIDFDFYELRHYFGTQLHEMGEPPAVIANQMGHEDGGQLALRLYIHPRSETTKRDMLERYEQHRRRQAQREQGGKAATG